MAKTKCKPRVIEPAPVNWKPSTIGLTGCEEWLSMDGMLMLRKQDRCLGAAMPVRWQVWQFVRCSFRKVHECRSHQEAQKFSAILSQKMETAE
jgi:hypothetical protein